MSHRKRRTWVRAATVMRSFAAIVAIWPLCSSSAHAVQPPSEGCRAASKIEYDSAKKQYLLRNRFGFYVRNGRIWRRHYWYCQF